MRSNSPGKLLGIALAAALTLGLGGCGGGGQEAVVGKLVVFGDSLSDVGTYRVGTIAALGGGQYTINRGSEFANWTEQLAFSLGVKRPCAARTGLSGSQVPLPANPSAYPSVTPNEHRACYSYAQGGARVTAPYGPGNAARGDDKARLGALTEPVARQIDYHLSWHPGRFQAADMVMVWAGANDLFVELDQLKNGQTTPQNAQAAMAAAGTALAGQVKDRLLAAGALHVTVLNLPDMSLTPLVQALGGATPNLVLGMTQAFNGALQAGLAGTQDKVLLVDIFARSQALHADPARFGNFGQPACDLAKLQALGLKTALICTQHTLVSGNTSTHFYADDVHPTPYGHGLITDFVLERMRVRGWR